MIGDMGRWHSISGAELADVYNAGQRFEDILIDCEAIYLWRRRLRAPVIALDDAREFANWLSRVLDVPLAQIKNRPLTHFAQLDGLSIRGAGLTVAKGRTLQKLASKKHDRAWMASYIASIGMFAPPLYCGETHDVAIRMKEHLAGESTFGSTITRSDHLTWDDLEASYYALGPSRPADRDSVPRKARRTFLELVTTSLTLSGYVERRG